MSHPASVVSRIARLAIILSALSPFAARAQVNSFQYPEPYATVSSEKGTPPYVVETGGYFTPLRDAVINGAIHQVGGARIYGPVFGMYSKRYAEEAADLLNQMAGASNRCNRAAYKLAFSKWEDLLKTAELKWRLAEANWKKTAGMYPLALNINTVPAVVKAEAEMEHAWDDYNALRQYEVPKFHDCNQTENVPRFEQYTTPFGPNGPIEISMRTNERKFHVSLVGGGTYLDQIAITSASGFYSGDTQGGAVGTLWGGSAFVDVAKLSFAGYSPTLSIGVVADQMNATVQFNGFCGGFACSGSNGSVRETSIIGELNLAFPLAGDNVINYYAGGGEVFKAPRGEPTGLGGPGIVSSDTAPAWRVGASLMHNFSDEFSAGFKGAYQMTGSTSYNTTMPGERFFLGHESELIFAAVGTFSFPVPAPPP
jgi:hypothetical protein